VKFHLYVEATVEQQKLMKLTSCKLFRHVIAVAWLALFSIGSFAVGQTPLPQQAQSQVMTTTTNDEQAANLPAGQLDSLVAPIALYPDQLLSQTLVASTYPLEIIQLQQWLQKNKDLKGQALSDAVEKQSWDPSIQAMAAFPDVVNRMADNIQWTTDLGNAFLAQQSDVLDAVQRMRAKAQGNGTLKTSSQQTVQTQTVSGGKQVIEIQPANPDVVYVPSYNPTVVYGAPAYPYPPIYYPPPGAYAAGAAIAFGTGVAMGAWWGNNWGWNCGWGSGNVNVNVNNKYVNNWNKNVNNWNKNVNRNFNQANFNRNNFNQANKINNGKWQHNPQHRGGAPYNRASANQVQNQLASKERGAGAGNRTGAGAGNRPGGGAANRPGGGGAANRPSGGGNRPGGGGGARSSTRPSGGTGKNQVGHHTASSRPSASRGGGFSGGSGSHARASSNRGHQSMSRGGGGHRGGGGRGGGGRRR